VVLRGNIASIVKRAAEAESVVTVRSLHLLGSPVLRQRSALVARVDDAVRRLVDDLLETMRAAKGVGLRANQVGVRAARRGRGRGRRAPAPAGAHQPRDRRTQRETRSPKKAACRSRDLRRRRAGDAGRRRGAGPGRPSLPRRSGRLQGRAVQHEIDHLDGVLFLDHLSAL